MDELEQIKRRHKNRLNQNMYEEPKKPTNPISKIFSKVLLSVIFILVSCIYIHLDKQNLEKYKKTVFESNITFAKINSWYHDVFGSILPTINVPNETQVNKTGVSLNQVEEYLDGYKITTQKNSPIEALASGILVYLDEKEGYGKTAIVQGVDGIDIWYGNITDTTMKLYDYIETGKILGNAKEEYYYNVFLKEGNKVTYEDYLNQIQS